MGLETATYISELNSSNPVSTDNLSVADDHMRLIKACLLASFPNFTAAALAATNAQLDAVAIPTYGSMAASTNVNATTSWATLTNIVEGLEQNVTLDGTAGTITIIDSGTYEIGAMCTTNAAAGASGVYEFGIGLNGADAGIALRGSQEYVSGDVRSVAITAIQSLSASDTLEMQQKATNSAIAMDFSSFWCRRIA